MSVLPKPQLPVGDASPSILPRPTGVHTPSLSLSNLTTEPPEPPWHGEVEFQQWNTIGWGITNNGVLCIKPWKGDTGETGPVTRYTDVPWYDQRSKIRKVESTGTIVLNETSPYLFFGCSSLRDLRGLEDWDVSNVTNMYYMFYGCSMLTDLT